MFLVKSSDNKQHVLIVSTFPTNCILFHFMFIYIYTLYLFNFYNGAHFYFIF